MTYCISYAIWLGQGSRELRDSVVCGVREAREAASSQLAQAPVAHHAAPHVRKPAADNNYFDAHHTRDVAVSYESSLMTYHFQLIRTSRRLTNCQHH